MERIKPGNRTPSHPIWCARQQPGCRDGWHSSADVTVAGDEVAGVAIRTALSGRLDRLFVELTFTPVPNNVVSLHIARALAGAIQDSAAQVGSPFVYQHPDDPIYITDPHEHDLTVDQARLLHQALGELLTLADG
jgi:hypothetical protein